MYGFGIICMIIGCLFLIDGAVIGTAKVAVLSEMIIGATLFISGSIFLCSSKIIDYLRAPRGNGSSELISHQDTKTSISTESSRGPWKSQA